jgi:hypothetical protein
MDEKFQWWEFLAGVCIGACLMFLGLFLAAFFE